MTKNIDILGIGNAIVDLLCYKSEAFLQENGFIAGSMQLISAEDNKQLLKKINAKTICSGGGVANTISGCAMLGLPTKYIGKISDDELGKIFKTEIEKLGVHFNTIASNSGLPTANCIVMVTEGASGISRSVNVERTMATFLGSCIEISEEDIKEEDVKNSRILFFESFLLDSPKAKQAINYAMLLAKKHGTKIAFTLSDVFCIERNYNEIISIIKNYADIIFANEEEVKKLLSINNIKDNLTKISNLGIEAICITQGEKGAYIVENFAKNGKKHQNPYIHKIESQKVADVYDVTGAGDLFAAGVLYGYVKNLPLDEAGKIGSKAAAEVIKYLGGRPMKGLANL